MTVTLYPDQAAFKRELYAAIAGRCRRIVGQAPTAFGKTVLAASIARDALDRDKRMIFVVHALTLVDQTVARFVENGIPREKIGVIQAKHELTDPARPIHIASVCTLQRRNLPPANVVIIDEIHRWFKFYDKWLKLPDWESVPIIGLSATPWTKGLGKRFSKLVIGATTQQLIDAKRLSDFKVFAPSSKPDLENVKIVRGDYDEGELSKVMRETTLVADVVDTWLQRAQDRPTLVFAVDRVHAKTLQRKFQEAGVAAGYIDCFTPPEEREQIADEFKRGTIKVVCNVGCLNCIPRTPRSRTAHEKNIGMRGRERAPPVFAANRVVRNSSQATTRRWRPRSRRLTVACYACFRTISAVRTSSDCGIRRAATMSPTSKRSNLNSATCLSRQWPIAAPAAYSWTGATNSP
jgi:DNA repair protein RadD